VSNRSRRLLLAAGGAPLIALAALVAMGLASPRPGSVSLDAVAGAALDDAARIDRGRYLALAGNCASCHTVSDDAYMAGGVAFDTPFGTIYSTNITPDRAHGIGDWTLDDFAGSMRHGIRPDGTHLYPACPYTAFTKIRDEDLVDLYAFLQNLPAVARPNQDNELSFPFRMRSLMATWKTLFFEPGAYVADPDRPQRWNRGAYLVEALAHCSACHSPRNLLGAERSGQAMTGGVYADEVEHGKTRPWSAPNLTSAESGLGIWSHDDLAAYLGTGRNSFLETFGPMNEVIVNSTQHLADTDIEAMATYLKSLPANEQQGARPATDERTLGMGRTQYNLHCGTCHLPTGQGEPEMAPRLGGGSLVVRASDPASLINVILYGPGPAHLPVESSWRKPMEEFRYRLDDDEVASLASFVRASWDNDAGRVTPDQVAAQR